MTTAIHQHVEAARRGDLPRALARMASGWAVLGQSQLLEGYCLLLPDPVVGSLNELDASARRAFLSDMAALGDAVALVRRPRRVNYEILGNLEPALHAHVIPRFEHEPPEMRPKPIWLYEPATWDDPRHAFDPARHAGLASDLRTALASLGAARSGFVTDWMI